MAQDRTLQGTGPHPGRTEHKAGVLSPSSAQAAVELWCCCGVCPSSVCTGRALLLFPVGFVSHGSKAGLTLVQISMPSSV